MELESRVASAQEAVRERRFEHLMGTNGTGIALVMLSGGIDSTVALYLSRAAGHETVGLEFEYHGRPCVEKQRVADISRMAGIQCHRISYPDLVHDHHPIRKRLQESNSTYLSLAANAAEQLGADYVVSGPILTDWRRTGVRDAGPGFFSTLNELLSREYTVEILTPLIYLDKKDVVRLGRELSAPLESTWSCPKRTDVPCGACPQCIERAEALALSTHGVDPPVPHRPRMEQA